MNYTRLVYPPEFVAEVKEMFPDEKRLHELLDANEYFAGRLLDDARQNISPTRVLNAFEQGPAGLAELQQLALRLKRIAELYNMWGDIVDSYK